MLQGEAVSAGGKTLHSFCFRGLHPWTPNGAPPLYPGGGLGGPQTPPPSVGAFGPQCGLLSYILLLLQIFFTTLTHLKLESLCYCLMQLLCIYSTTNAVVLWDMVCNFFSKNLFSLKNNTCDFKSNLHCMLIWFWNHAYSFMISDQITPDTQ